jgi:haloacetate dehalogenase
MTDNTHIERRTLLHTMAAASGTALSSALLSRYAAAADAAGNPAPAASDHFETAEIETDDNTIFVRRYGKGAPRNYSPRVG